MISSWHMTWNKHAQGVTHNKNKTVLIVIVKLFESSYLKLFLSNHIDVSSIRVYFTATKNFWQNHIVRGVREGSSPLIFRANQRTGFYMIEISIIKELKFLYFSFSVTNQFFGYFSYSFNSLTHPQDFLSMFDEF